jgi:hypothetical protein
LLNRPGVALGFLASALVAWGGCNAEFTFDPAGWPQPVVTLLGQALPLPWDRVAIVAGTVALCLAWWLVRPRLPTANARPLGWTLALWSLPFWLAPPALSPDVTLYADAGHALLDGVNPYTVGLAQSGGPYASQVDPLWQGTGVAYPPLALRVMQLMVWAAGDDPYFGYVAMRLPVLLAVAAMLWLVPRVAELVWPGESAQGRAVWLGVLNPLLLLHLVGGGHNDAPMIAVTLLAVWVALRFRADWASLLAGPAIVGVAMAFKQQGGLAVLAVALAPYWSRPCAPGTATAAKAGAPPSPSDADRPRPASPQSLKAVLPMAGRLAAGTVVALASFAAVSLASGLGFGWIGWMDLMGKANTAAPLALLRKVAAWAITRCGGDPDPFLQAASAVSNVVLVAAMAWIVWHFCFARTTLGQRPMTGLAWGSLALCVLGQALHPWYLPWCLANLALVPLTRRQRRWAYGLCVAFTIWNAFQTAVWHGFGGYAFWERPA